MDSNESLVKELVREGWIKSPAVKEAFLRVDRRNFVTTQLKKRAYENIPLPIGFGQTISQPLVVALTTEALGLKKGEKVLDVGGGSGYQAAIASSIVRPGKVYCVERVPQLTEFARENLKKFDNVAVHTGDGTLGWVGKAPFDAITVAAACPQFPPALVEQLREGGRIVAPVGSRRYQKLVLGVKKGGKLKALDLLPVVFVPLVGEQGFK